MLWRLKWVVMMVAWGVLAGCGGSSGGGTGSVACSVSAPANVCVTTEHGAYNGLGVHRFARFSVSGTRTVNILARCVSGSATDPDLVLYRNGQMDNFANTTRLNQETLSSVLTTGDYVVELIDYNHYNSDTTVTSCFNLSVQVDTLAKTEPVLNPSLQKILPSVITRAITSTCSTTNQISLSGNVRFDRVPHNSNHSLDYTNVREDSVRGAVVEVICAGGVYAESVTDANGAYTLNAPNNISSFVRVKAQMLKTNTPPTWNLRVEDNTSGNALYAMDSSPFVFATNQTDYDLHAASGWGGSAYTSTRVAAPFAILDSAYVAMQKVLEVDASAVFPALNINWSVNNVAVSGDVSAGNITTSHYNGIENEIYILGDADDDADEYDGHVIIHEWAHYFERQFSRADNIGGPHGLGDIIDIRVAFGEGWGNAYSAMASGDPVYSDAGGVAQSSGFGFNVEHNNCSNAGWYSECSVQSILYDIYDTDIDGVDNFSMGFGPIYNVLINEEKNTAALTSIFSFITPLKINNSSFASQIDTLTSGQNINVITDIYGDSQISNNPGAVNQLPIYLQF